ncbi:MAG: MBL fold metallo-hydrolase [Deltaproteobacteria bacterium]|nr:MBL fold metallo-hydrolase [Deltaproteobacteria bacterium]
MKTRITILCENTASIQGGLGEHGFSAYLETERGIFLFDTGRGATLIPNLLTFGKDPRAIQKIILSHGHHDHTGGFPAILELVGDVEVWAHPDIFSIRYKLSRKGDKEIKRFVGMKFQRAYLESLGARFILDKSYRTIVPGLDLTGEIPRRTAFETGDPGLVSEREGILIPDPIADDNSLVIDSPKGLVLVLGCAHSGLINILQYVLEKTGRDRLHAVIGGTHLDFSSSTQVDETIAALKKYRVERIGMGCYNPGVIGRHSRKAIRRSAASKERRHIFPLSMTIVSVVCG